MRIAVLDSDNAQLEHTMRVLSCRCAVDDSGIDCIPFRRAGDLRRALRRETFDLLVLDLLLPDASGDDMLAWLRGFRGKGMPVLILSARSSELEVVKALETGADDYVIQPFRPLELAARCRRLLSWVQRQGASGIERFGPWRFDHREQQVRFGAEDDTTVGRGLTDREFRLALSLFRNAGRAISRAHLLESAGWSVESITTRLLDNHVSRLRQKLGLERRGVTVHAIYGQGYRLSMQARDVDASKPSTWMRIAPDEAEAEDRGPARHAERSRGAVVQI
jgi:DNA-binding response OmpR family regulator